MHPRERRTTRRHFLFASAGALAALSGADALLRAADALAGDRGAPIGPGGIPLARRELPGDAARSTPTTSRSRAARTPREGPLNVFNWSDYINPAVVKEFEKEYGVKVKITTFENEEEALAKLTSGQARLRRLVRDRRVPVASGRREADPAARTTRTCRT